MKPVSCSCHKCRTMCARSTCVPTPEQARELIRRGYGARLATYEFRLGGPKLVAPAPRGREGARGLPDTLQGACTFYRDGLCELHTLGLKPLEGQLAHHDRPWPPIRMHVASQWQHGRRFDSIVAALDRATAAH